jgi:hypothetical protein
MAHPNLEETWRKNAMPKKVPTIVKDPPEIYVGRVWVAVNIRERGEFRVEMFSGKTAWEAEKLAKDRINELLN